MAKNPPATVRTQWLIRVAGVFVIGTTVLGLPGCRERKAAVEEVSEQTQEKPNQPAPAPEDPQVVQQRAVAEARAKLNLELLADDGTFFPATADIEVGSILYTVHQIGPEKLRYYTEDTVLAGRQGDMLIVRPILERARPAGAPPQNYRSQGMRSGETKREEIKQQKKITAAELTEKYAARVSK